MTTRWWSTIYYQMIIVLIGFIVSQLFIAVVCFGFENLEETLSAPTFSNDVIGQPYVEQETDPEDALCNCLNPPMDPLAGADLVDLDRGTWDGIRIDIRFLYHQYPPEPLDVRGRFGNNDPQPELFQNPLAQGLGFDTSPLLSTGTNSTETPLTGVGIDQVANAVPVDSSSSGTAFSPQSKMKGLSFVGSGSGLDTSKQDLEYGPEKDHSGTLSKDQLSSKDDYSSYRAKMAQWKREAEEQLQADSNPPFQSAAVSETPREIGLNFSDLKAWSNQRVSSIEAMLRAQQEMETDNVMQLFHDSDGAPGQQMGNEILADLVIVNDNFVMPELTIHVRSFIKVRVEPLTDPNCDMPEFSLIGNECIGDVKHMALEHMKAQDKLDSSVVLEHCQLYFDGEVLIQDELSLWQMCLENIEGFDPMTQGVFFAMTVDQPEAYCLSQCFDYTVMTIICLNAIFLSIDHYGASDGFNLVLDIAEWVFNVVFTIEMFVRLYCMKGFCNYWRCGANRFDFTIVCSAWVNLFLQGSMSFLKVLRVFRALRLLRVLRKVDSVKLIIDAAGDSMQPIINIMMFMLVVLIVYSCMGMQLYGFQFQFEDEEVPRENFDNFIMAFLGLFQVLSGSAWELVLYDCMRANRNAYFAVPFLLSFFVLSNYIILNLFIGAILSNMGTGSDEERLEVTTQRRETEIMRQRLARETQLFVNSLFFGSILSTEKTEAEQRHDGKLTTLCDIMEQPCAKQAFVTSPIGLIRLGNPIDNVALYVFPHDSSVRQFIYALVTSMWFEMAILVVIVYSTILLALVNPDTANDSVWQNIFEIHDIIFLVIFTIEFGLKVIAYGFIWCDNIEFMLRNEHTLKELMLGDQGPPSYMYEAWNHFDLLVLVVSYVNVLGDPEGPLYSMLRLLRLVRAFRPLRMINRVSGMKLVVMSLAHSLPALSNVCVLLFAVFLIFGILGVSLFLGKFQFCNDAPDSFAGGSTLANCYGHISDGDVSDFWMPKV